MLRARFLVRAFNSGVSKPPLYGGGDDFAFLQLDAVIEYHSLSNIT